MRVRCLLTQKYLRGMTTELAEQVAYYRAIADEYEDHAIDQTGGDLLRKAVINFAADGDVLELACGPGAWTEMLLTTATTLTAVDAAPEMIARAERRASGNNVRFIHADVFTWEPSRSYDVVFFGFLLSHIPDDRFDTFWALIGRCLRPGGRVLFVDDNYRSAEEQTHGATSEFVERRLNDGSAFTVIKVPHKPPELEARLRSIGWNIDVTAAGDHFYWGQGTQA